MVLQKYKKDLKLDPVFVMLDLFYKLYKNVDRIILDNY